MTIYEDFTDYHHPLKAFGIISSPLVIVPYQRTASKRELSSDQAFGLAKENGIDEPPTDWGIGTRS